MGGHGCHQAIYCNVIWFGDIHGPKPYEFIGLRWACISQTPVTPTLYHHNHENPCCRDPETIDLWALDGPNGGARSAPPFGVVSGAPGAIQTPKSMISGSGKNKFPSFILIRRGGYKKGPSAGRRADFGAFPEAVRPKSGPEGRLTARRHYVT